MRIPRVLLGLALLCIGLVQAQQIQVADNFTPTQLIEDVLITGCAQTSNISSPVNGTVVGLNSFGFFERGNTNFPFENGIVLTTGNVLSGGNVVNNQILNEGDESWGTDADIEAVLGTTGTFNATAISFNFVSVTNQISFRYLLASEEYFADFPCFYADAFAILIRPSGSGLPFTNIALIPGTTTPVNTNNIRPEIVGFCPAANEEYFFGFDVGDTNYNGRTTVLTASAAIVPNQEYEIKLVIADQNDSNYDSAVFIEANSFTASVDLGADFSTCADTVALDADVDNALATYQWFFNDVLVPGENSAVLQAGQTGNYRVEVSVPISGGSCNFEDDINITLSSTQSATPVEDVALCDTNATGIQDFDLTVMNTALEASVPPANYNISYHTSLADAEADVNAIVGVFQNTSNPQTMYARIEDADTGCLAFNSFNLIVNPLPPINAPTPLVLCDDNVADGVTQLDLTVKNPEITTNTNLVISYHLNLADAQSGASAITMPYTNSSSTELLYVRVLNPATGCAAVTPLELTILDTPDINLADIFIDACDADLDGQAVFDLNEVSDQVLQGLTGVTLSFHESLEEAQTGTNPIVNTGSYQNTQNNVQTLYIRVVNDSTGCAAVRSFEIHTNLLLTETLIRNFTACDEDGNGTESFNLQDIAETIANNLPNISVNFYLTPEDRLNQVNALSNSYSTNAPQTQIYLEISSPSCTEYADIRFNIAQVTEFDSIGSVDVCDAGDQDGIAPIRLTNFNNQVTNGQSGFGVSYFLSENDAQNNQNPLPNTYTNSNSPFQLIVYVRIFNLNTGCAFVNSFIVNIIPRPSSSRPSDIIVCDDDQDGIVEVNLNNTIDELVTSTENLLISFHVSVGAALDNNGIISNAGNFSTGSTGVAARIENAITGCVSVQSWSIVVNTLPVFPTIENYRQCTNDPNAVADFFMETKDAEILNGQTGKRVLYFETLTDAENSTNPIDKTSAYQNTSSTQTIYVRVENISDTSCFGTSSFQLEVGILPIFNQPSDVAICDDISNDGVETFDLEAVRTEIEAGSPDNLQVTFYLTEADANNAVNAITTSTFTNTVNPQTLFARIENDSSFCFVISSFSLGVIQIVNQLDDAPLIVGCDRDYDGVTTFNLIEEVEDLLDVRQENILLSFFETEADLINNTNAIPNPDNYSNINNPQILYFRITNIISGCSLDITVSLEVALPPVVNNLDSVEICDNALGQYDLTNINSLLYGNTSEVVIRYYAGFANAEANTNVLNNNYSYQSANDTLFARVAFADTGCFFIQPLTLLVNPLPEANQPPDLEACDDSSEDGLAEFDLASLSVGVLGSQSNTDFTVSYHSAADEAATGANALPDTYTGANGQTIYVRVENNTTGCFSVTQFNVIVNEFPNTPQPLQVCDDDYDGLNTFDLTQVAPGLFDTPNPNIVVTYFTTVADLESDVNAIATPAAFQNTTNPQTVFIKTFNTAANCFNTVALTLEVNLPPAINPVNQLDVCFNTDNQANLEDFTNLLLAETTNVVVSYYSSLTDATNQTNALEGTFNYTADTTNLFARVSFSTTGCFFIQPFTLVVNPLPVANTPADIQACDDGSEDGVALFDLSAQDMAILSGQDATLFTVSYYASAAEAANAANALPVNFNGANGQTIYARVENNTTGCFSVTQFSLIVNEFPNTPDALVECDDDYDGLTAFDLTQVAPGLFDTPNPNIVVTYFTTVANLESDVNAIATPEAFQNTVNPQTVFIKTFNTSANCFNTVALTLEVNLPPAINPVNQFDVCFNTDNQANLDDFTGQLLAETTNVVVSYYSSLADATNQTNALSETFNYTANTTNLFARVSFSTTGCFFIHPFTLVVNPLPEANTPADIQACDDSSEDGVALFDLSAQDMAILGGQDATLFTVSYYAGAAEAASAANALPVNFNGTNGQTIYARVENNATGCFSVTQFNVIVNEFPNTPDALVECDDDYDGLTAFDLTQVAPGLFDTPNPNIVVTYFTTIADLEAHVNAIATPAAFQNTTNPQTVFIKTFNTAANCFNTVALTLEVNLPPAINPVNQFDLCFNTDNQANLDDFTGQLLVETTNVVVSYYSSLTDATNQTNALAGNFNYTANTTNLFARVSFSTTGCFFIQPFTLVVNPLPVANAPADIQACDDSSEDGVALFDLSAQDMAILGSQDATLFMVSYYAGAAEAASAANALPVNFNGTNGQTIYARVENNTTGCFSVTQFSLIVNEFPNTPDALIECDDDYDGLTAFDLTEVASGLFDTPNPNIVVTYFTTIADLEAHVNAIATPEAFQNTTNPQTVFIKTFNTAANCFNTVALTLEVNLPPAINPVNQFDLCFNTDNQANLEDFTGQLLAETTNVVVSYYGSLADATNQTNALAGIFNYTADTTDLFARVEFSTTGCFFIQPFTLVVNPLPVANAPGDLEACDDDFNGLQVFDLSTQTAAVLGAQSPTDVTVTYHNAYEDAEAGINALDNNYQAIDMETIYVRVEDNLLGCFNTTSFSILVHPRPVVNIPDQVFCPQAGPLVVSADTGNPEDTYMWFDGSTGTTVAISEPGTYSVRVTSIFGCETEVTFGVTESASPVIESVEVTSFLDPNRIVVNVSGSGDYYYFLDGEGPQTSNVFENVSPGFHTVTVIDLNGCEEATQEVVVIDAPKFMTPNNDGYFDTWHIAGVSTLPGTRVSIFDRYGKLLAVLDAESPGWDGTYRGVPMPGNDYWFVADVVEGERSYQVRGHFTLKR